MSNPNATEYGDANVATTDYLDAVHERTRDARELEKDLIESGEKLALFSARLDGWRVDFIAALAKAGSTSQYKFEQQMFETALVNFTQMSAKHRRLQEAARS